MNRGPIAKDLRQRNRARVLRHVLHAKETTRGRIATECNISAASAANVASDLIEEGLVRETGLLPSLGGRPVARLSIDAGAAYSIGVDVGEQGVTVELFDLQFNRIDRVFADVASRAVDPGPVARAVLEGASILRSRHPEIEGRLLGVGLGLPGVVDLDDERGPVIYAQSLGWPPVRLAELFDGSDLSIYADNGAKTLTVSEMWFGAAQGVEHGLVTLIGRGIGMGIISASRLFRGVSSSAGEWGHTKVSIGGPACQCGGNGCLEAYVGGAAIGRRWRGSGGRFSGTDEETLAALIREVDAGEPLATRVMSETLEILGIGLANLVNLFNPERIVIGGWAGQVIAASRLAELDAHVRASALERPGRQFDLVPCVLGSDSIPLGAALLPIEQLIEGNVHSGVMA